MKSLIRTAAGIGALLGTFLVPVRLTTPAQSQVPPATLAEALYRLPVYLRVLHTAAHPDDENNSLLVYLSRGLFARTAYLSTTRGDGGQNIIGNELGEALGVLRTEELLAAQQVEAVDQYFTRAYDFGFTRSAEETMKKWGREEILSDFVRIIRRFRPDIIISRFSGTPSDGHGQHQATGILAREAFRVAGDSGKFPKQFTEGLHPWEAKKLYLNRGRFTENREGVSIDLGVKSSLLGKSYLELGVEAVNFHRSQLQARTPRQGSFVTSLQLVDAVPERYIRQPEQKLTDGIDISIRRLAEFLPPSIARDRLRRELALIDVDFRGALDAFRDKEAGRVLTLLRWARRRLYALSEMVADSAHISDTTARDQVLFAINEKLVDTDFALALALGFSAQAKSDSTTATPGSTIYIDISLTNGSEIPITPTEITIEAPVGSVVERAHGSDNRTRAAEPPAIPPGTTYGERFRVSISHNASPTEPYWLRLPRTGDRFQVEPPTLVGLPELPPPFRLRSRIQLSDLPGDELTLMTNVMASTPMGTAPGKAESVKIVPKLAISLDPEVFLATTLRARQSRAVRVQLTGQTDKPLRGLVGLNLPDGWVTKPKQRSFIIEGRDQHVTADFQVLLPRGLKTGRYIIRGNAKVDTETYTRSMSVISYPHVRSNYLYQSAEATVGVYDIQVAPGLKVGYVTGHGDLVPPALRALGVNVTELDPSMLLSGDLGQFDCIVIGSRAYEGRQDLVANNGRVLDYVRQGGTLVVQYQVTSFNNKELSPFTLRIANEERVTDEKAPVRILDPEHPLFRHPNRITERDFADWVQERGLYFATSWDEKAYKPLLESHDLGEKERYGGMLLAHYGEGRYLYTAYSWFRQLPAGVPGAYRLFANLMSYGRHAREVKRSQSQSN